MSTAVMFRCTSNFFYLCANMIINLESVSSSFSSTYVIFTDNVTDHNWNSVKIVCNFYNKDLVLKDYSLQYLEKRLNYKIATDDFIKRYTHIVFSIFEIFDLLKSYEEVLALDLDMIVYDDICGLRNYLKDGTNVVFRKARTLNQQFKNIEFSKTIDSDFPTPNAGLIFVSNKLDFESLTEKSYLILSKYINNIVNTYEETVLGLLFWLNKIDFYILKDSYNVNSSLEYSKFPIIIHMLHQSKPWHVNDMLFCYPEIIRFVEKFHLITDSKYRNIDVKNFTIYKTIRRIFYSKLWECLFLEIVKCNLNLYILNNCYNNYLKIYFHGVPSHIHYEIIVDTNLFFIEGSLDSYFVKNKIEFVKIELHFESQESFKKAKNIFVSRFSFIGDIYYIEKSWQFGFGIKVQSKKFLFSFLDFYNLTFNLVMSNFAN